ncbi:MAG: hypothetical protein AAF442_08615 [Pseudomonadota bacterium]
MLETFWTSADFRRKIDTVHAPMGVYAPTGAITMRLDAYHTAIKKAQWGKASSLLVALTNEMKKYLKGLDKNLKQVRQDKGNKSRIKALGDWEKATDAFSASLKTRTDLLREMEKLAARMASQGREAQQKVRDIRLSLVTNKDDEDANPDATVAKHIQNDLIPTLKNIEKILKTLKDFHPWWQKHLDPISTLMRFEKDKTITVAKAKQILKITEVAMKSLPTTF